MFLAVVAGCLLAFMILCWVMWDEIERVVRWQRKQHDRISKLEVHEMTQDSKLDRQQAQLKMVKRDIEELGKDVGWDDNKTKTQSAKTRAMFPPELPDDEPPDEAA